MKFNLNVKRSNPIMDATNIQPGDMLVQQKDSADRKIYMAAEILGDIKLINLNSAQTYNIDGYGDWTRQQVLDEVSAHFNKYAWKFIPVEDITGKDINVTIKG